MSLLYEISQAMMTTIQLDDLLKIIMTAVTMESGLGFNRAMLFLVDDRERTLLRGMIGVGPESAEDAHRIWREFSRKKVGLLEWVLSSERASSQRTSRFDEICRSFSVPLDEEGGLLARTVRERTSFNVFNEHADEVIWTRIFSKVGGSPFACIPIVAKGEATGVFLVDNCYNQRPIEEDDVKLLTVFANQAGLAIENSRLYHRIEKAHAELRATQERLLHTEKLVALGEMAASIAHEIKTPLVSIGGFARRLYRADSGETREKYLRIIIAEVERLEEVLNQILVFSREPQSHVCPHDLNTLIEDTLTIFPDALREDRIQVVKELGQGLPAVFCDYGQIKEVFINLIANACQAMAHEGTLTIRSAFIPGDSVVTAEVEDTGGGIATEIIGNIFNPFFTTKEQGLGLGLAITHRIVTHNQGTIEVRNNPGKGTTFVLKFPCACMGV